MTKTQQALHLLSQEKFQKAHCILTEALHKNPLDTEAQMGILLWDVAQSDSSKALGLLEFYFALLLEISAPKAQHKIISIIHSIDQKETQELEHFSSSVTQNTESHSCISYEDFKNFILTKPNFKEAFEDFSLSTKIIFSRKEEVYEFLNFLIDKGYADLSVQYAENITESMGFDLGLNQILQKAFTNRK